MTSKIVTKSLIVAPVSTVMSVSLNVFVAFIVLNSKFISDSDVVAPELMSDELMVGLKPVGIE